MIFVTVVVIISGLLIFAHSQRGSQGGGGGTETVTRGPPATPNKLKKQQSFDAIKDNYKSLPEVVASLRKGGLESSNLVIGIDFTKSNNWTGDKTFGGKSLHFLAHDDVCTLTSVFCEFDRLDFCHIGRDIMMCGSYSVINVHYVGVHRHCLCHTAREHRQPRPTLMTMTVIHQASMM